MRNKSFFISMVIVFLLSAININSQDISFKVGDEKKTSLMESAIGIVSIDDKHIYCLNITTKGMMLGPVGMGLKGKISLDVYNPELQAEHSIPIPGIELEIINSTKTSFEFFAEDEEKNLYLYFSEKEKKQVNLKRMQLNKQEYKFMNEETISTLQVSGMKSDRRGTFGAFSSPEKNYTAVFSWAENNKQGKEVYIEMLDRNLNSIWKKEIDLPFDLEQSFAKLCYLSYINGGTFLSSKSKISVTENGELRLLLHAYDDEKQVLGKMESDFYLVSINEKEDLPDIEKIQLDDKEMEQLSIKNLDNENILIAGYYSNKKSKAIGGIYFCEYDLRENKEVKSGTIQLSKQYKDVANSNILDLQIGPDSSFTLVSEYYSYNISSQQKQMIHYFGDITLINASFEGNTNWIQTINKKQVFPALMLLSTKVIEQNNCSILLYNTIDKAVFNKISGKIMCSIIDAEGNITHKVVSEFGEDEPFEKKYISPLSLRYTTEGQYTGLVYSLKNNPSLIQLSIQ